MKDEKFRFVAIILCFIICLVFILQAFLPGFTEEFVLESSQAAAKPWILMTSIFLHGSLEHLLSNLFALGLFGSILEKFIGTRKFLLTFFAAGLVASAAASFFYTSSLGASGAIFGLLGCLAAIRPRMIVWTYGVPMPMFIAACFWFLLDLGGVFYPSSIANIAHIAGLISGIAIGLVLRRAHSREEKPKKTKILKNQDLDDWEKEYMQKI